MDGDIVELKREQGPNFVINLSNLLRTCELIQQERRIKLFKGFKSCQN